MMLKWFKCAILKKKNAHVLSDANRKSIKNYTISGIEDFEVKCDGLELFKV